MTTTANLAYNATKSPARLQALRLCASAAALLCFGATAQATDSSHPATVQTAAQTQQTPTPAPAVDDKYKPRVYGGTSTPEPAPVTPTPQPAEQQANIILNENLVPNAEASTESNITSRILANAKLNSAPNWTNGIRDQFIDVIAGVPIMKDPENCAHGNPALKIKVTNVKNSKGIIVVDLHDDVEENFLVWDKVVLRVRATAQKDETSFCMPVPKAGNYAVAIYHDKNSNTLFDKNFLGLPKERFGMSNNPKFGTKSPKFEEAVFEVPAEGKDMLIKLRRSSDVISGNQD